MGSDARRGLARTAWLLLALLACGAEPAPVPSRVTRVALEPADDARPLAPPTVIARLAPDGGWQIEAPLRGVAVPDWLPRDAAPMLQLAASDGGPSVRAVWAQPFDAMTVRRLQLEVAFDGAPGAVIALQLLRRGRVVIEGPERALHVRGAPRSLTFDLPVAVGRFDGLALVCRGERRVLGLGGARLLALEPGAELPDARDGARLVRLGGAARRALGLLPGRALEADVEVPASARLLLAWGQPAVAAEGPAAPDWELSIDGGPPIRSAGGERGADGAVSWRTRGVDLGGHAGREVRLRLSLVQQDRGALALAVPELGAVGEAPPTVLLVTGDRGDLVDRVAQRGSRFTDLRPPSDADHATRMALHTGLHPRDSGWLSAGASVPSDVTTLAEVFARAGYVTAAAVGGGTAAPGSTGLGQGFDRVSWPSTDSTGDDADVLLELFGWLPEVEGRPLFAWVDLAGDGSSADTERSASLLAADRLRSGIVMVLGTVEPWPLGARPVPAAWSGPDLAGLDDRDGPARWIDVGATLASNAGVPRGGFPGRDLLVSAPDGSPARFALAASAGAAAVSVDGLSLVLALADGHGLERHEVWLTADGEGDRDLSAERPDDARRLRVLVLRWLAAAPPGVGAERGVAGLFEPDGCPACTRWDG